MGQHTTEDAAGSLTRLMDGSIVARLVCLAAETGLADMLADGPRPVDDLAAEAGVDPDGLHRALRVLAAEGVFAETAPRTYALTPLAGPLRSDTPDSVRDLARIRGSRAHWAALGALGHSVATGRAGFDHAHGTDWWSHLAADPEAAALFARAMGEGTAVLHETIADAWDFSTARCVVDVGGGRGDLVRLVLQRHPTLRAAIIDREHAMREARRWCADLRDRVELVAGDFRACVPTGGDVYVLSRILHDWADDEAVTVLRAVAEAASPGARVLVVDTVVPEHGDPHPAKTMDVIMLAVHGGRERTDAEFRALLTRAGLVHDETRPTAGTVSLVIGSVADPIQC